LHTSTLHAALLLHLLHLLHHLRVHAAVASALATAHAGHHLLHHLRVLLHCSHLRVHAALHATALHLLLHHLEVLLHTLPVLCHHCRAHVVGTSSLRSLVLLSAKVGLMSTAASACAAEVAAASSSAAATLLAKIAAGLGALDFDGLAVDREGLRKGALNGDVVVESHEAETAGTAGVFVHHESAVEHIAELGEELTEIRLGGLLAYTSDEDL
jgi:hypothetical protein